MGRGQGRENRKPPNVTPPPIATDNVDTIRRIKPHLRTANQRAIMRDNIKFFPHYLERLGQSFDPNAARPYISMSSASRREIAEHQGVESENKGPSALLVGRIRIQLKPGCKTAPWGYVPSIITPVEELPSEAPIDGVREYGFTTPVGVEDIDKYFRGHPQYIYSLTNLTPCELPLGIGKYPR